MCALISQDFEDNKSKSSTLSPPLPVVFKTALKNEGGFGNIINDVDATKWKIIVGGGWNVHFLMLHNRMFLE